VISTAFVSAQRSLRRRPLWTALTIVALALALGLNIAVYGVVDALINPIVAVDYPEQLVAPAYYESPMRPGGPSEFLAALEEASTIEGVTSYNRSYHQTISRNGVLREVEVANVAPDFFEVVRATPVAGVVFTGASSANDGTPLIISVRTRNALFRHDENPLGVVVRIGNDPGVVVGVLDQLAGVPPQQVDVWRPAQLGIASGATIVRLKPGVTKETAFREFELVRLRLARDRGASPNSSRIQLLPVVLKPFRRSSFHLAMVGAAAAALLIAALNIASLQIARGLGQIREWATRAALGASRGAIVAQLTAESALLSACGVAGGLIVASWGLGLARAHVPLSIAEYWVTPQWSWRVGVASAVAFGIIVCLTGLIPGIRIGGSDLGELLRSSGTTGSRRARRVSDVLVVFQVALALPLCVASTLLAYRTIQLERFDPGVETRGLVAGRMHVAPALVQEGRLMVGAERLVRRIRALEGIVDAAAMRAVSGPQAGTITVTDVGGTRREVALDRDNASFSLVTPTFFRSLGLDMVKGRDFNEAGEVEPTIIVNEAAAEQWWPRGDPVGQLVKLGPDTSDTPWLRVAGVHSKWHASARAGDPSPSAYYTFLGDTMRAADGFIIIFARTRGDATRASVAIRGLQPGGAGSPAARAEPYGLAFGWDAQRERQRFVTSLFVGLGALGLGIAAFGAYAISAHGVSQRIREFGVRLALGAPPVDIIASVLRETNLRALLGIILGLLLSAWTVSWLRAFMGGLDHMASGLFAGAALVLLVVVLLATLPTAIRAASVDIAEVLRND
jgi:predicted permease